MDYHERNEWRGRESEKRQMKRQMDKTMRI